MSAENEIYISIAKIDYKPGETIVLTMPWGWSGEQIENFLKWMTASHPEMKFMILPNGTEIKILSEQTDEG